VTRRKGGTASGRYRRNGYVHGPPAAVTTETDMYTAPPAAITAETDMYTPPPAATTTATTIPQTLYPTKTINIS